MKKELSLKAKIAAFRIPPGETLKEILKERGLKQSVFARSIKRPIKLINEIIKGKASITPETAIQFEEALGVDADFWLNLQKNHDLEIARRVKEIS